MSKKTGLPVGAALGFVVSLFASTFNDSAYAASKCLTEPNRASGPGTQWKYRVDQTTHQRCWYLKQDGERSHPRPTSVAHATRSRVTREASTPSRAAPVEVTARAQNESSVTSWIAATFGALSGSSATTTETREPAANEAPPPRKRRVSTTERTENSKVARAQQMPGAAAADKDVIASSDQPSEWQKALYEEFLQWRVKQLLFQ
jgi:hypothetical protein